MLRISGFVLLRRLRAVVLSTFVVILGFASAAIAERLDFQAVSGDYNVAANWLDYTDSSSAVPTVNDEAVVRNGGTLNITAADGDALAAIIRVGSGPQGLNQGIYSTVTPIAPADPASPIYAGAGTLNFTGANIFGNNATPPIPPNPANTPATGARLNVGDRDNANNINYTGIVNHSGGKISLNTNSSFLVVGAGGTTPTPTSQYNLSGTGIIALTIGSGNTNNGINVRNGTFTMTGGSIEDDPASTGFGQRAMTISSTSGAADGTAQNVATANISGGTWNTRGGIRLAANSSSSGYLNISGTADIKVKSDVNMCNNATNCYSEINMSAGSFKIGESAVAPTNEANLIVGDRSTGVMNLSGGTVSVSRDFKIANDGTSGGPGTMMMTGGTMTTRSLIMRDSAPASAATYALATGTLIIDGPTASFTQTNTVTPALTGSSNIGRTGIALFEVRQGFASLGGGGGNIELAATQTSASTLNLKGGRLVLNGNVTRTNTAPGTLAGPLLGLGAAPVVGLTGGILELNTASTMAWQTNFKNQGSDVIMKTASQLLVNVGVATTHPANFEMSSGSLSIDIASNTLAGADRFAVQHATGTASLTGGTLNLNYLPGYPGPIPNVTELFILRTTLTGGVTLNASNITINAPGGDPNWYLKTVTTGTNHEIRLAYIPEPTSCVMIAMGLLAGIAGMRRRP